MLETIDLENEIINIQKIVERDRNKWHFFQEDKDAVLFNHSKALHNSLIEMAYETTYRPSENLRDTEEIILMTLKELIFLCYELKISPIKLYKEMEEKDYRFLSNQYNALEKLGYGLLGYINNEDKKEDVERVLSTCMTWIDDKLSFLNYRIEEENKNGTTD